MGDRTDCTIICAKRDREQFDNVRPINTMFHEAQGADDPLLELFQEEANYAYYDELCKFAKAGCIFDGSHGEGGEYGAADFCAIDGEIFFVPTNKDMSGPLVEYDMKTGEPIKQCLERFQEYFRAYHKVKAYFEKVIEEEKERESCNNAPSA